MTTSFLRILWTWHAASTRNRSPHHPRSHPLKPGLMACITCNLVAGPHGEDRRPCGHSPEERIRACINSLELCLTKVCSLIVPLQLSWRFCENRAQGQEFPGILRTGSGNHHTLTSVKKKVDKKSTECQQKSTKVRKNGLQSMKKSEKVRSQSK